MEQEIFQRKQFTFYESFYKFIKKTLRKKTEKLAAYEALIQYALYGQIEDFENLPDTVCGMLELFYPILDTARNKAKGGAAPKDNGNSVAEDSANKNKNKIKNKDKDKFKPKDKGNAAAFERFWDAYPKKAGRDAAYQAFLQAKQPLEVLLQAIDRQKDSRQWKQEQGRYIPCAARWLEDRRWTEALPPAQPPSPLEDLELRTIRRIMNNAEC